MYKKDRLIARYQYNSQGQRTQKIQYKRQKAITFSYFYDLGGHLIAEYKNHQPLRDTIWIDNQPQIQIKVKQRRNGNLITRHTTYLTTDHLNTPRIGTDEQQTLVWRWQSDGFGRRKPERFKDHLGRKRDIRLRFPGQYHDQETGLHYNGMRYYDPKTGRYITSDPIGLAGGLNTFAYVGGNPVNLVDPTGENPFAINFAIEFAIDVASQLIDNDGSFVCVDYGQAFQAGVTGLIDPFKFLRVGKIAKKIFSKSVPTPATGQKVYRVYGGDAKAGGASWSPVNPASVKKYRHVAGLPSGGASGANNSGRFVIEGTLQDPSKVVKTRSALPLDGNKGGIPEYIIPNALENGAVKVNRVGGVNPEF